MTFHAFTQGREFFHGTLAGGFHLRLHRETKIDSLYKLYAWCRLRYPDFYYEHQPFMNRTGKQMMQRIWADYLAWAEAD